MNDNVVPSLAGGSATGFGGLAVRNDIESGATAKINAADVDSIGDVTVSAIQSGTIKADAKARVETTGSSKGKSVAINGVIATNNVRGYAKATIDGSDIVGTSAAGDIDGSSLTVTADSTLAIDATIDAETISKQKAAGITLAFNTIGIAGQNFLFNAIDTLVGTDLVGSIYGHDPNASVARHDHRLDGRHERRRDCQGHRGPDHQFQDHQLCAHAARRRCGRERRRRLCAQPS